MPSSPLRYLLFWSDQFLDLLENKFSLRLLKHTLFYFSSSISLFVRFTSQRYKIAIDIFWKNLVSKKLDVFFLNYDIATRLVEHITIWRPLSMDRLRDSVSDVSKIISCGTTAKKKWQLKYYYSIVLDIRS